MTIKTMKWGAFVTGVIIVAVFILGVDAFRLNKTSLAADNGSNANVEEIREIVREYLLEHPEVVEEALINLQRMRRQEEQASQGKLIGAFRDELIHDDNSVVAGNPDGKVTLVEFFDYNCGFCKRSFPDLLALRDNHPEFRLVLKEYPVLGPTSITASRAALAARKQNKYLPLHDALMKERGTLSEERIYQVAARVGIDVTRLQADMEDEAIIQVLRRNHELAEMLGISGTPSFIIGDRVVIGAQTREQLDKLIEEELADQSS